MKSLKDLQNPPTTIDVISKLKLEDEDNIKMILHGTTTHLLGKVVRWDKPGLLTLGGICERGAIYIYTNEHGVKEANAIIGDIFLTWQRLNGREGVGVPLNSESYANSNGRFNDFILGKNDVRSIYWKYNRNRANNAFLIYGGIRDAWLANGGSSGSLGFPISEEKDVTDAYGLKDNFKRYQIFEKGKIYWKVEGIKITPTTGLADDYEPLPIKE